MHRAGRTGYIMSIGSVICEAIPTYGDIPCRHRLHDEGYGGAADYCHRIQLGPFVRVIVRIFIIMDWDEISVFRISSV